MGERRTLISLKNVSKSFKLPHERHNSIKHMFVNMFRSNRTYETQHVLNDISFEVKEGEFFGIVGRNGSGKSTLLKLLAGIYVPDSGEIKVNGKVTPFIELGVGFNPELTGRENIYLNGALLGFTRKTMEAMYDDIVAFAELEKFMDQKLKNYSSGMQVRLAFSIAIKANSDILLLDEVLAVGDAAFQRKCFDYFRTLKKEKKTVVFISHDMNAIREYCDRVVLIERGDLLHEGSSEKVAQRYLRLFADEQPKDIGDQPDKRWGNNKAKIQKVKIDITPKLVTIKVACKFNEAITDPIFGMHIISPIGVKVFESNTRWKEVPTGQFAPGDKVEVVWEIPNYFTNGMNLVTPAIADTDGMEFYDHWEDAAVIDIQKEEITTAVVLSEASVKLQK